MITPIEPIDLMNRKGKPASWETAIGKIFTGLAFLIVAVILGITGAAGAKVWWFWLLIPAFGSLGSGFAQYVQLKKLDKQTAAFATNQHNAIPPAAPNSALPPTQTEYIAPESPFKTGDLAPPSVIDSTTRHLRMDSEGETMSLPKKQS